MNILFFTQLFYPIVFGGGEYIFYLIAKELARRGHNVHVVTQRLQDTTAFEIIDGIRVYRIGTSFEYSGTLPPTIKHNLAYLIHATKKGRQIIKHEDPIDIIHSNTYVPALSGQLCSKLYQIPHIITFHDVYQASNDKFWKRWMEEQNSGNIPFYASILSRLIERIVMKLNVSAIHTVSDASRDDLIRFGVTKTVVIPNGLDQSQYSFGNDNPRIDTEPTAVFIGRLVFYKNVDTIIKAFKEVVKTIPNAKLMIIGDGPYREVLARQAKEVGNQIIFTGRISHSDKIQIIMKSSFMVFPSIIEGFGIAIIEAFACKKPVLVSNVRPLSDIVSDGYTGYTIDPFNINAWAQKMIELFNDGSKRKEMGSNAYQTFLSKYEIQRIVSAIELMYSSVRKETTEFKLLNP